ncbi:hypothetical protein Tco_0522339 [Tanacetum coccineum]
MQKYILKQQFEGFTVSNTDGIHKGYERFQSLLSQLEIHGAESVVQRKIIKGGMAGMLENKDGNRTGKKEESKALVTVDGESVDWTTHSEDDENFAFMASNSSGSDTQKVDEATVRCPINRSLCDKFGLGYGDYRYSGILSYENEVFQSVFKGNKSDFENLPLHKRLVDVPGNDREQGVPCDFKDFNGALLPFGENQANLHAGQQNSNQNTGTKDKIDAEDSEKEDESAQDCFELQIWHSYSSTNPFASKSDKKIGGQREEEQVFLDDLQGLRRQEKGSHYEEAEALSGRILKKKLRT